jgi:hypothetical protein
VEDVHELVEVVLARRRIVVALHVVTSPEGVQVVKVYGFGPVFVLVDVSGELSHKRMALVHWSCLADDWLQLWNDLVELDRLLCRLGNTGIGKEACYE